MNPYILVALFIAGFGSGWEVRDWKDAANTEKHDIAQQQVTIDAEKSVIDKQKNAGIITNKTEMDYEKTLSTINGEYASSVQPNSSPASGGMPTVSRTSSSTCPPKTKAYQLTRQECDAEEAKAIAFWNWYANQRK